MFGALRRLVLYRLVGGRIMLALTLLGWVRGLLGRRKAPVTPPSPPPPPRGGTSVYQPSQGESQIVQREPR